MPSVWGFSSWSTFLGVGAAGGGLTSVGVPFVKTEGAVCRGSALTLIFIQRVRTLSSGFSRRPCWLGAGCVSTGTLGVDEGPPPNPSLPAGSPSAKTSGT